MRIRFTIRDLLWLTALVALAVARWIEHRKLVESEERYAALEKSASIVQLRAIEQELRSSKLNLAIYKTSRDGLAAELAAMKTAASGSRNGTATVSP
jgi:hypothetical protein